MQGMSSRKPTGHLVLPVHTSPVGNNKAYGRTESKKLGHLEVKRGEIHGIHGQRQRIETKSLPPRTLLRHFGWRRRWPVFWLRRRSADLAVLSDISATEAETERFGSFQITCDGWKVWAYSADFTGGGFTAFHHGRGKTRLWYRDTGGAEVRDHAVCSASREVVYSAKGVVRQQSPHAVS